MTRSVLAASLALATVTATTLAGCASGLTDASTIASSTPTTAAVSTSDATPSATREATPTATTSPPPALSQEQAAERYLDIIRPYNEALERLEQAINSGQPLATQTALAGEATGELEAQIGQLRASAWPAEVRTPVDELVAVSEKALEHWQKAAGAETRDDLIQAVLAAAEFDGTDPASTIRELLDLDPYDERDYQ